MIDLFKGAECFCDGNAALLLCGRDVTPLPKDPKEQLSFYLGPCGHNVMQVITRVPNITMIPATDA